MSRKQNNNGRNFLLLAYLLWALVVLVVVGHACFLRREPTVETTRQSPAPLPQILVLETAPPEEPEPLNLEQLPCIENATLTHYCSCKRCCGKDESHPAYGITASGRAAEPYVSVAVDPSLIPLGSTVYLDDGNGNLQTCRADDTGSGVTGAHIDLCVSSHGEALELGVKTMKVYWEESK